MGADNFAIGDILTRSAKYFPERTAVVFEGRRLSYAEINDRVNRLANGLMDIGIKKGDNVVTLFYNSSHIIESNFAVAKIGAIAVPLNYRLAAPELSYVINNSASKVVICGAEFLEVLDKLLPQLPQVKHCICDSETISPGMLSYEKVIAKSSNQEPYVDIGLEDGYHIYYTSGTTGFPKGLYATHRKALWSIIAHVVTFGYRDYDISLGLLPFYHLGGWINSVVPFLLLGGTVITAKAFDIVGLLEAIERERITYAITVPTVSARLCNFPDIGKYDLTSLRVYVSMGAVMPFELKKKIMEHVPNVSFIDGYGLTENMGGVAHIPPIDALRKEMSGGMVDFDTRVRIVDEGGKDLPQGQVGEIVVQSPRVLEYYLNKEATKEAIKDGWFHTGDLAMWDEEGYVCFVDRKKDMIVTGGENVYSAEVENIIYRHPKIAEAAIIGLPDKQWGDRVTAVVVLKPNEEMTEQELKDFCREHLAGYKCPKEVKFLNEPLPKSGGTQKILKRELKARFL